MAIIKQTPKKEGSHMLLIPNLTGTKKTTAEVPPENHRQNRSCYGRDRPDQPSSKENSHRYRSVYGIFCGEKLQCRISCGPGLDPRTGEQVAKLQRQKESLLKELGLLTAKYRD